MRPKSAAAKPYLRYRPRAWLVPVLFVIPLLTARLRPLPNPSWHSNLQGLNSLFSPSPSSEPILSDADLASTLALWTNIDFSYDDGGIGLNSGLKLLEEDRAREAREQAAAAAAGNFDHSSIARTRDDKQFYPSPGSTRQQQQHTPSSLGDDFDILPNGPLSTQASTPASFPVDGNQPTPVDPFDPFGFHSTLFALAQTDPAELQLRFANEVPPNFHAPSSVASTPRNVAPAPPADKPTPAKTLKRNASQAELPTSRASSVVAPKTEQDEEISHEDDKRRRNTAASARFRAKKKEREQALEKSSKELQNRYALLEKEVESLRRENVWLKGLVVGGGNGTVPVLGSGLPTVGRAENRS
ncbi:regulatory protein cys-transcription factor [Phaffia rhodozyma]|uniref:Regulatory protein cys-transcription factor n=1 Tax=Phaffia rhodozyma TaxID=264483 RepID=A0A0F7SKZ9_PHARH|nr:regulatory protein cys-transcription factor [Phaffia rhodozyma]